MRSLALLLLPLALVGCLKPDHIEMDPKEVTFSRRGDTLWLHAIFKDNRDKQYPKQSTHWTSSNEAVVKVDDHDKPGNLTAMGPGHATIIVKGDDGLEAEVPVTVVTVEKVKVEPQQVKLTLDGERVPLVVTALDVNGHPLRDRKPHLKCANEKICNADDENGVWPAGDPGQTTVEVTVDEKSVTVPVVVEGGKGKKK